MPRREFLQTAAAVAGDVSDTEIVALQDRLLQLADRGDDARWAYETTCNFAHVSSGLLNAELDALCDHPSGTLETHAVGRRGIPLGCEVSTDDDESVGTLVHRSAEQAEALAVDLLEQDTRREGMTMQTSDARVTARIVRPEGGETLHEYEIGGVGYGALEVLEAALNAR